MRDKILFCPQIINTRSLRGKATNNIHYLYYLYYCHFSPKIRLGIIIITRVVPKILFLYRLNNCQNILDPDRKIQAVIRMKVDSNKGICPDFGRNVLDGCRDDNDELALVDPSMHLKPCQLQELPCFSLVLLHLEFIIRLIESTCTRFLLTNLDTLLCKKIEGINEIHVRNESIICEE